MKKIEINPVDMDVKVRAESVKLWNEFKEMGFIRRKAFKTIVREYNAEYWNNDMDNVLNLFWVGRMYSNELNKDLQVIMDKLKSE